MAIYIGNTIVNLSGIDKVYIGNNLVYQSMDLTIPLCFTANTAGSTVELTIYGSPPIANTAYSRDGITWTTFTPSTEAGTNTITLTNIGDKVYFRNDITNNFSSSSYLRFIMSGSISASGNCNSMYISEGFGELTTLSRYCYQYMFYGCTSLTTAPLLPATTLVYGCYSYMFYGCTSLTTAPALPATTLVEGCYQYMFRGCTSLTNVPALPATTLARYCYAFMFQGCTSLTNVPALPATTLANGCYAYMFYGCTSLYVSDSQTSAAGYAWRIPTFGTFAITSSQNNMFTNCLGSRSSSTLTATSGSSKTYYTQNQPIS